SHLHNNPTYITIHHFKPHPPHSPPPLSTHYPPYTLYHPPPNSQPFTPLLTLNIFQNYHFTQIHHRSFHFYHLLLHPLKNTFVHRNPFFTHPPFAHIPLQTLLHKNYPKRLPAQI
ncbi:gamma-glutamyltransferase, partial [Bacillus subtilis]|uniref:gamma-glutamyltransferase n=1 Tax=Bacillus subtilis TaxID=1423 RepID=UPI00164342A7